MKTTSTEYQTAYRSGMACLVSAVLTDTAGNSYDVTRYVVTVSSIDDEADVSLLELGGSDVLLVFRNETFMFCGDGLATPDGIFDGIDDWEFRLRLIVTTRGAEDELTEWVGLIATETVEQDEQNRRVSATFVGYMGVAAGTAAWDGENDSRFLRNITVEALVNKMAGRINTHEDLAVDFDIRDTLEADPNFYQVFQSLIDDPTDVSGVPLRMIYLHSPSAGVHRWWLGVTADEHGARSYIVTWNDNIKTFTGAEKIPVYMPTDWRHTAPGPFRTGVSGPRPTIWGMRASEVQLFDPILVLDTGDPDDLEVGDPQTIQNLVYMVSDDQDPEKLWVIAQTTFGPGELYRVTFTVAGATYSVTEELTWGDVADVGVDVNINALGAAIPRFSFCNSLGTMVGVVWWSSNEVRVAFIRVSDQTLGSTIDPNIPLTEMPERWVFVRSADRNRWAVAWWTTFATGGYAEVSGGWYDGQQLMVMTVNTTLASTSIPTSTTLAKGVAGSNQMDADWDVVTSFGFTPAHNIGLLYADHPNNATVLHELIDKLADVVTAHDYTSIGAVFVSDHGIGQRTWALESDGTMENYGIPSALVSSSWSPPQFGPIAAQPCGSGTSLPDTFWVQPIETGSAFRDDRRYVLLVKSEIVSPIIHELDTREVTVAEAIHKALKTINATCSVVWDETGGNPVMRIRSRGVGIGTTNDVLRGMQIVQRRARSSGGVYDGVVVTGALGVRGIAGTTEPASRVLTVSADLASPALVHSLAEDIYLVVGTARTAMTVVCDHAPHIELLDRVPMVMGGLAGHVMGIVTSRSIQARDNRMTLELVEEVA